MEKRRDHEIKPYYVPTAIQMIVTYSVITLFLISAVVLAVSTVEHFLQGSDYRPQLSYLWATYIIPIGVFLLAYTLNPRKLSVLSRSFETLLITFSAVICWSSVLSLFQMIRPSTLNNLSSDMLASLVFVAFYAVVFIVLRRRRLWS